MSASREIVRVPVGASGSAGAAQSQARRPWLSPTVGLALWTVVVGFGSALMAMHIDAVRLQRELVLRPPVVVVNTMDWIQHAGTGSTPAVRYANGAAILHATIAQLKAHGALVLDASALHTYPAAVRLDPPHGEAVK